MSEMYKTPDSDLNTFSGDIDSFERFSAWGVFGLSVITFGVYVMYWFLSRTKVLNGFYQNKIPDGVVYGALISYVVYFVGSLVPQSFYTNDLFVSLFAVISLVYLILYLVWVFKFRSRLLEIAQGNGHPEFRINPALTFFFQSLYLQYKINQYIDNYKSI